MKKVIPPYGSCLLKGMEVQNCYPKSCWNGNKYEKKKLCKGLMKKTCKYMVFKIIAHLEQTEKRRFHNS